MQMPLIMQAVPAAGQQLCCATNDTGQLRSMCLQYGCHLPCALLHPLQTTEKEMVRKEHNKQGEDVAPAASEEVIYKIDIPANRYDMLCVEGISRALNVFSHGLQPPSYKVVAPSGVCGLLTLLPASAMCAAYFPRSCTAGCAGHWASCH